MKKYYKVVIKDYSSWNLDGGMILKTDCGHKHSTLTSADRCLNKLSEYWAGGAHNEWARFGCVIAVDANGLRNLTGEESQMLDDIAYDKAQHRH